MLGQVALLQLRQIFGVDPAVERIRLTGHAGSLAGPVVVEAAVDRTTFDELGLAGIPSARSCLARIGVRITAGSDDPPARPTA